MQAFQRDWVHDRINSIRQLVSFCSKSFFQNNADRFVKPFHAAFTLGKAFDAGDVRHNSLCFQLDELLSKPEFQFRGQFKKPIDLVKDIQNLLA